MINMFNKEKRIFKIEYIKLTDHVDYIVAKDEKKALKKFYRKHQCGYYPDIISFREVKLGEDGKLYAI